MKNKLFVLFAVVLMISAALAVSASAFTVADTGTIIKNKQASATQIPEMVAVFEKQATLGYIPTDTKIVFVGYDTDVGYMRALGVRGDYSAVTATASGSYATYTASSNILSVYAWTESGWIHENDTNRKVQVQNKILADENQQLNI